LKSLNIEYENKTLHIIGEQIGDKIWYHCEGETYCIDSKKPRLGRESSSSATQAESGKISSPMPGKVIKVLVALGDSVQQGQTLVVLEAMKMEYSLESDVSGKITGLNCSELDQVKLGELLVEVESDQFSLKK